jgi:hypothetical protein
MTKVSQHKSQQISFASWIYLDKPQGKNLAKPLLQFQQILANLHKIDIFQPLKEWLDNLEIKSSNLAHQICKFIPSQCPFERNVQFLGRTLFRIPPLCKLNPVYDQLVGLRFRALCYLVDVCGEDISAYC